MRIKDAPVPVLYGSTSTVLLVTSNTGFPFRSYIVFDGVVFSVIGTLVCSGVNKFIFAANEAFYDIVADNTSRVFSNLFHCFC